MQPLRVASLLTAAVLLAAPASADVVVKLENGQASVSATNATVREILAEWARVGQTRIVNVDRVAGNPMTLELSNVPELQALDVILRTVSGYVAAPRAEAAPNASQYDRIYLLATSTPAAAPPRPATPAPAPFQPANVQPDDQEEDDVPSPNPPRAVPPRPPFNTFPQPRPAPQQQQQQPEEQPDPTTYTTPTAPFGVATPGMPVPVPQQPGQPGAQPR